MEWKEYKLGDVCSISSSKRIFASEYKNAGIPFYRGKEIIEKQKGNNISNELFISHNRYIEIKEKFGVPQEGDLLLTSVGTLGIPYVVKNEEFYFKDGNLTWFKNFKGLNSLYLYYWFLSPDGRHEIDSKAIGSTQKALTIDALSKFCINLPNLNAQKQIINILSSLDAKIENNNKINANLEAQAAALFKSWFVDFEPFRDGEFVESELGMIPKGWKILKLNDICEYSNRKISINSLTIENYYSTENMLPNKTGVTTASSLPQTEKTTGCIKYDVLVSNIRPYFKKIYRVFKECGCSTDVLCFHPLISKYNSFLYSLLFRDEFFDYVMLGAKGTKMPRGDKRQIMNYTFVCPSDECLLFFSSFIEPIFELMKIMEDENQRLSSLRDTLLPKLMSGEIDLENISI